MLLVPMVLLKSANTPFAVFKTPSVLLKSARAPVAVFRLPVLARSVPAPTAVLSRLVAFLVSENRPGQYCRYQW